MKIQTMILLIRGQSSFHKDDPSILLDTAYFSEASINDGFCRLGWPSSDKDTVELIHGNHIPKNAALHKTAEHIWILFDTCNGSYDDPKGGSAHIFVFPTREAARKYQAMLKALNTLKPNSVITVSGPHKYLYY